MAKRAVDSSADRPLLLVGAGRRAGEVGAVLAALAELRTPTNGNGSLGPHGLEDLEELLARGPGMGTLVLEYGRVPAEDIGFVRRFLERHPAWRLVVLGDDPAHFTARALLGLPRAQWLPWPPDLVQLGALLGASDGEPATSADVSKPPAKPEPRGSGGEGKKAAGAKRARNQSSDLGSLVEELLAGDALAGAEAPRYLFRCDSPAHVAADRAGLTRAMTGLFSLTRAAAGPDGVVSVRVDPLSAAAGEPEGVLLRIDFPAGPLAESDVPALLERADHGAEADDPLGQALADAARSATRLRDLGAEPGLAALDAERLRLSVHFPRALESAEPGEPSRRGKDHDPFA